MNMPSGSWPVVILRFSNTSVFLSACCSMEETSTSQHSRSNNPCSVPIVPPTQPLDLHAGIPGITRSADSPKETETG